ncbi:MAG: hypothetical protein EPO07_16425 [Verrucomicrobia bacterium]|nr:MAG: hypothetical protein EPO07_16425 [Verrucomicrobiota bacterium]
MANKLSGATVAPAKSPEFRLRLSQGTERPETAVALTSADFRVLKFAPHESQSRQELTFALTNEVHQLGVEVSYELSGADHFMRKWLEIISGKAVTLERIDVEVLNLPDAWQPFTNREITANAPGRWNPGLGQPLYTSNSATFWGVEFPAADNYVRDGGLYTGYLWGRKLQPGQPYRTYAAVMGVADDPAFVTDAFFDYINRIRARPLRLQVQYNSWFDFGSSVSQEKFAASVLKVNQELVTARGNRSLNAYVIDDGWQDAKADWSDKVWKVNEKFDPRFTSSLSTVKDVQSRLGLWMSPGCLFGAHAEVAALRAQGFEALDDWMSMAGPRYMQALEDRLVELTRQGIGFYKLDGLFGHLNLRNFELHGEKYGLPAMPQLGLQGFTAGDARLNDPRFDELKIYYLTAGTERLMQIFSKLGAVDPDIYIVISNGAYLSPWWLMYVDAVWMINAGDAAKGGSRSDELVYRDGRYHDIWRTKHTQFPMSSVFNHEPKKTTTGESPEIFQQYLFMSLSRGTGLIELYLKPSILRPADWDVLSEGLHWATERFPTFARVRMHGGRPEAGEVYGYTAWDQTRGYISVHNPSDKPQSYTVKLDRAFGLPPRSGTFHLSSPLAGSTRGLPEQCKSGDSLTFELSPREIRILDFDSKKL